MSRYNPFSFGTPRRPRRLTWYTVITQIFTLLGRIIGRAATGGGSSSSGSSSSYRKPRRSPARRSTYRR